ncbi:MAG: SDR family NAD(P)-dependent oxidoreductase [Gammaproteobacteria bacterium]|jgi:NAD(P)-dependent dehydrogenase (short-subunit alcohol dehydrogenase family)|nr:SDR family NAD(P)-dependent oxidoreductase [Gammaproteobacteria bacterium]MDH5171097.1 SDR family NAD(P)-dependent oxidoreductase [Gammaproteobacteria bacterium]
MLDNLRVVITGAAGSLGQATAAKARQCGAHVIGLDIVAATSLANTDEYLQLDLLDREATLACFKSLGKLDVLVNIAGGFAMGDAAFDPGSEQWDRMFRLNVDTMRNATMGAVPLLQAGGGGAIVNIGALGALSGQAAMSAYCCAKSSVMKLTESLSEELKNKGVNVNAVLPSIIDTAPNRKDMPDADFSRWVSPAQLAEVICFLASPAASAIHGALVPVRGLV